MRAEKITEGGSELLWDPRISFWIKTPWIVGCFLIDKNKQVAQWALVYSFLNVDGSQTQPRDSFQHCREDFGEFGKVRNGMNVCLVQMRDGCGHHTGRVGNGELGVENWE